MPPMSLHCLEGLAAFSIPESLASRISSALVTGTQLLHHRGASWWRVRVAPMEVVGRREDVHFVRQAFVDHVEGRPPGSHRIISASAYQPGLTRQPGRWSARAESRPGGRHPAWIATPSCPWCNRPPSRNGSFASGPRDLGQHLAKRIHRPRTLRRKPFGRVSSSEPRCAKDLAIARLGRPAANRLADLTDELRKLETPLQALPAAWHGSVHLDLPCFGRRVAGPPTLSPRAERGSFGSPAFINGMRISAVPPAPSPPRRAGSSGRRTAGACRTVVEPADDQSGERSPAIRPLATRMPTFSRGLRFVQSRRLRMVGDPANHAADEIALVCRSAGTCRWPDRAAHRT